jgi:hypothetical protein
MGHKRSFHGRPTGMSSFTATVIQDARSPPSTKCRASRRTLLGMTWEGVDRLRGMRHKRARPYFEVVRQRHSAVIAANKLSVAKRTGKFSTWSDDAATQQVAANIERTVSSSTDSRIVAMPIAMITTHARWFASASRS